MENIVKGLKKNVLIENLLGIDFVWYFHQAVDVFVWHFYGIRLAEIGPTKRRCIAFATLCLNFLLPHLFEVGHFMLILISEVLQKILSPVSHQCPRKSRYF